MNLQFRLLDPPSSATRLPTDVDPGPSRRVLWPIDCH